MNKKEIERVLEDRKQPQYIGKYGIVFLDDYLIGIHKEDFVLIGAESGVGKSELAYEIAYLNSLKMPVHLFALEADKDEPTLRKLYKNMAKEYYTQKAYKHKPQEMSYRNFLSNKIDTKELEPEAIAGMQQYQNLTIHYRQGEFSINTLTQKIGEVKDNCKMIVLDHIDYFDLTANTSEVSQVTSIMKTLRDINQVYRIPIVIMSHLRKRANKNQIIPTIDDFYGSSNKAKIAKTVILLARNYEQQDFYRMLSPTWCYVAKSRLGSTGNIVGSIIYDYKKNVYLPSYALGKIKKFGEAVEDLGLADYPTWAKTDIATPF